MSAGGNHQPAIPTAARASPNPSPSAYAGRTPKEPERSWKLPASNLAIHRRRTGRRQRAAGDANWGARTTERKPSRLPQSRISRSRP